MDDTLVTAVHRETGANEPTSTNSAATRHLCAGVYVDRIFRDLIIRKVHNDARHRIAPSYGFDLVPVVRHAWRAWLLDTGQLAAMLGILVTGLLTSGLLPTVLVACVMVFCRLLRGITRELPEVLESIKRTITDWFGFNTETRHPDQRNRKRRLKIMLTLLLATTAVPVGVAVFLDITAAVLPAAVISSGLVVCAIVAGVVRQLMLSAIRTTPRQHNLTNREETIDEQQNHPCVIYRRPPHREGDLDPLDLLKHTDTPSPFVGSGKLVNQWSPLTIQLLRPGDGPMAEREYTTPPFTAHELVEALRVALTKLGTDPGKERLPDLRVRDRIYIAATDFPANGNLVRNSWENRTSGMSSTTTSSPLTISWKQVCRSSTGSWWPPSSSGSASKDDP